MEPEQELTFGQKAKMGFEAAKMFARNPKALVAVVKYQLAQRKQGQSQPAPAAEPEAAPTQE
jgi:hypothetical protein